MTSTARRYAFVACAFAFIALHAGTAGAQARRAGTRPTSKPVLPPAPAGVVIEQDVPFLDPDRHERLDLYLPADRAPGARSPAVVMIHGGGWVGGDKAAAREVQVGTTLARAGYVCASVDYQLSTDGRWPTNLLDCKNGVRFLRANAAKYDVDPQRIGVMGGSAGGHLALMVAYTSGIEALEPKSPYPNVTSDVRCVVNLYGITNLLTRRKTDEAGTPVGEPGKRTALLEPSADADPALWRFASPVTHASATSPPTLVLHGTADTTVDRDQAHELAAKLKEHGVEHRLIMLDGVGHTFDLVAWRRKPLPQDLRPVVLEFFGKHLKKDEGGDGAPVR